MKSKLYAKLLISNVHVTLSFTFYLPWKFAFAAVASNVFSFSCLLISLLLSTVNGIATAVALFLEPPEIKALG